MTNRGTCTTAPVSSVAGLLPPVTVSPRNPGAVSMTRRSTAFGNSTPIGVSSWKTTVTSMFSVRNRTASPSRARGSGSCSNVALSITMYSSPVLYRYCIVLRSRCTSGTRSPPRKVRSVVAPVFVFRTLALTKPCLIASFKWSAATMTYTSPSSMTWTPGRRSLLEITPSHSSGASRPPCGPLTGSRGEHAERLRRPREDPASAIRHDDGILDPHPTPPREIDPRLDGDDHAGLEHGILLRREARALMDFQADAMTE